MLSIDAMIDESGVLKIFQTALDEKEWQRAIEQGLDDAAFDVMKELQSEMETVFHEPTRFTLNSLKVTKTKNHNMEASVWLRKPDRMGDHYLLPQILGGVRKTKGFERALGDTRFFPARGLRLNKAGNVSRGLIIQILSALGLAEQTRGYQANRTDKSSRRNKKRQKRYVHLSVDNGKLPAGIYQRVGRKERNLKPIMLEDKEVHSYKLRFKFNVVAENTANEVLPIHVEWYMRKLMAGGK